ncbi:MAG: PIG-L family deacetylase [Proteobacteria bacterium]|nr:PIG-L family deacetylase [Desulfobacteraceae bacterium]MBU4013880.1 PIG-L family deacetylase [Pseudomonadota bacterium]MBU4068187.1 PIG-L family deacetylase [Pseudomonadota bacterium]MBU4128243.1 PIG-L family deacetylase [Pseudomonadota bacterium]
MRCLVIAAHPDDEVLGCGGSIARLSREGNEVLIAIMGEGITSRYARREEAEKRLLEELQKKTRDATTLLGAKDVFLYNLPDNQFDTVPMLNIVKIIEELVYRLRPEVVYTQHGGDLNIDHTVTFRATLTATRPMAGCPVKDLYAYEVPSSTEWAFQRLETAFHPNVFVDISATIDTKILAMQKYDSEARKFPHPRSPEALRAIARRWGSVVGFECAEAFELIRSVR